MYMYILKQTHIPNPFIAFLSACASEAGSKSAAGRTVGLIWGSDIKMCEHKRNIIRDLRDTSLTGIEIK